MHHYEDLPFPTQPGDQHGYERFRELIWHNSEVCNACFARVRTIGPDVAKQLETSQHRPLAEGPPLVMHTNAWYERTEYGSQEHVKDANLRFGTCFCLHCGSDCNGNHKDKSVAALAPLIANIYRYVARHTEDDLDGDTLAAEVTALKGEPAAQGYETEVMAVAFARALEYDRNPATAPRNAEA